MYFKTWLKKSLGIKFKLQGKKTNALKSKYIIAFINTKSFY